MAERAWSIPCARLAASAHNPQTTQDVVRPQYHAPLAEGAAPRHCGAEPISALARSKGPLIVAFHRSVLRGALAHPLEEFLPWSSNRGKAKL